MKTAVSNGERVQDGDLGLKVWITKQAETYNNIIESKRK